MEYAIAGMIIFISGVALGLSLKARFISETVYNSGYDHGFSDASMAVEFLEKRMEGK